MVSSRLCSVFCKERHARRYGNIYTVLSGVQVAPGVYDQALIQGGELGG